MDRHDTLLLGGGTPESRRIIRNNLGENYYLLEAGNIRQTLLLLEQNRGYIAAVLLDMTAPEVTGRELPEAALELMGRLPVILLTADDRPETLDRYFAFGAADVIPLDYDPYAMLRRIETIVQLHLHRQNLQQMVQEQAQVLRRSSDTIVDALSSIIEYRSVESGQHILRIRQFTRILLEQVSRACPEYGLTGELIQVISSAAALHDVGKIGISDAILLKPGPLTAEEREVMKTHTQIGCQILESLDGMGNRDYLRYAHHICHYHHERWDGGGYPEGLSGEDIPVCAQVVGLADVYDALTSRRVYKEAFERKTAANMILRGECGAFSSKLLECFKAVLPRMEEMSRAYADGLSPKTEVFETALPEAAPARERDSMEIINGKFQCLLHYVDAFVLELAVDRGYFHLRYNPYPELGIINQAESFRELEQIVLDRIVAPQDRQRMQELIHHGIENYLQAGMRRQSFRFFFREKDGGSQLYDVTLLRANVNQKKERSLAVLCRKATAPDCGASDRDRDMSDARRAYEELKEKISRYEIVLAQTENVLFDWNVKEDTITFSDTWKAIFGSPPLSSGVRRQLAAGSLFHPDDLPLLFDGIRRIEAGSAYEMMELRMVSGQGRYIWCRFRASAIRDKAGRLDRIVGVIINIDAEKQAERALQDRAERDALTKLLNKEAGRRQAEEYLNQFPEGVNCALLIIDLDNFKTVNDRYGHLFGDSVLTRAAKEIRKLFRTQDIVARIGGDEFMVLMRGVSGAGLVENRCQDLLRAFRTVFREAGQKLPISCSVGVALAPDHGRTYVELFRRADQALYQAKAQGRDTYVFSSGTDAACLSRSIQATAVSNRIDSDDHPGLADVGIVQYAFQRLYGSRDVDASIQELLALIGQQTNVSRVYVFENSMDNRFCSNTYEWCNTGVSSEKDNLQNVSYEDDIPGYEQNFDENGIFYCPDIRTLPRNLYDILAPQGICSILHCAIRERGAFRGYIGFDDCRDYRMWTRDQIDLLMYFSEMLSVFLLKMRSQEQVERRAEDLNNVLDNQNAWIYIVDPRTHELKYLNAGLQRATKDRAGETICHCRLEGNAAPCRNCPMEMLYSSGKNDVVRILREGERLVLCEATRICWEGEDACMITWRDLPEEGGQ